MMLDPMRLWAKSKRKNDARFPSMGLERHLRDVHSAASRVLDATAIDQLAALGLNPRIHLDRLRRIVLLAAACHDLGKANDQFQDMVRGERDVRVRPQGLRHEWVTLLILQKLRTWLAPAVGEQDFAVVEWCICGHHPAFDHASPPRSCPPGAGPEIVIKTGHPEFASILSWLREAFQLLDAPPALDDHKRNLVNANNVFAEIALWAKSANRVWETICRDHPDDSRFVAAAKNCLVAADVAGSALPKSALSESDRWQWITQTFAAKPRQGEIDAVVKERSQSFTASDDDRSRFQTAVASASGPVTLVKAGCGAGKTLAAYMWSAQNHPTRRLFFCYPTTGTATEGFKDYLVAPEVRSDLFHSRREVDFEMILTVDDEEKRSDLDAAFRIESLDAWSTPIVACTVDTVLGIVQNNRRGLFAWPALSQSAFVFDEIHAYDDRLFGALLRFLRDLPGLPALLMTASLPMPREEALRAVLAKFRGVPLQSIAGPASLELFPRYHKAAAVDNDPLPIIRRELEAGGKALWVCNTVGRVLDAARRAEQAGLCPLPYHSRFKYEDRVQRHKDVVDAFTPKHLAPTLAICSQVAEMSLDLKGCTLLVSDLAPTPSLIQRLGRLNRHATAGSPTRPFLIVEPETSLPYSPAELEAARIWFDKLPDHEISQRQLADLWEQTAENPPDLVPSAWLDGGPRTTVCELREASPGITVLMDEDASAVALKSRQRSRRTLSMPPPPRSLDWRSWRRVLGIPVAPPGAIIYDKKRGAAWAH